MWMKLAPSNHNPKIIARYYLECVENCGGTNTVLLLLALVTTVHLPNHTGCPAILRCDYGTENVNLATIQIAFRLAHDDPVAGTKSFMYGPSTSNIVSFNYRAAVLTNKLFF